MTDDELCMELAKKIRALVEKQNSEKTFTQKPWQAFTRPKGDRIIITPVDDILRDTKVLNLVMDGETWSVISTDQVLIVEYPKKSQTVLSLNRAELTQSGLELDSVVRRICSKSSMLRKSGGDREACRLHLERQLRESEES